jgi:aryl-alcohol dehydrogenase-like predicted oxidoreductase
MEIRMSTRRQFLGQTALVAALGSAFASRGLLAAEPMQSRAIPSSGEAIPVVGMGSSGSFEVGTDPAVRAPLRDVLRRFAAGGGRLIDTAPSYSTAEDVLGDLIAELGLRDQLFLATKLSGVHGRDAGLAQFEASLARLRTDRIDLLQVHNLGDWQTQLALAGELKAQGKVRYVGLTHYRDDAQAALADAVRKSRPDFLQINYSVTQRAAEKEVLPMAQELGVAVLTNRNFDDGALFSRVAGKAVPDWAKQAGIESWAQLFLKFALSHPAVTAVIPATGKPHRQSDNLRAGFGAVLDAEQRKALIAEFA